MRGPKVAGITNAACEDISTKRKCRLDEEGEDAQETHGSPRDIKRLRSDTEKKPPSLACPFFKRDPLHYMDCLGFNLKRIQDVKQHLQRKHYEATIYCPTCGKGFHNEHKRDAHLNKEACTARRKNFSTELIQPNKQEELRSVSRSGGSDEKSWVQIWRILFGDEEPPESPYQKTIVEEAASFVKSVWEQQKSAITDDVITQLGPEKTTLQPDLALILSKALAKLFDTVGEMIHDTSGPEVVSQPTVGHGSLDASIASTETSVLPPTPPEWSTSPEVEWAECVDQSVGLADLGFFPCDSRSQGELPHDPNCLPLISQDACLDANLGLTDACLDFIESVPNETRQSQSLLSNEGPEDFRYWLEHVSYPFGQGSWEWG